ncbi:MAG: hypothetical protein PWQ58_482 [Archaeoglobaceae archaeon]|nr:hypothetical protein [Archaeoglobaceae archaeon]
MRPYLLVLIFAIAVYGVVLAYTFGISPIVKENSIESWNQKEASRAPVYVQSDACKQCHLDVFTASTSGNHSTVECSACHGSGREHASLRTAESILIEDTRDACMICHKNIAGRNIATVDESHGSGVRCSYCHDPHSANISE